MPQYKSLCTYVQKDKQTDWLVNKYTKFHHLLSYLLSVSFIGSQTTITATPITTTTTTTTRTTNSMFTKDIYTDPVNKTTTTTTTTDTNIDDSNNKCTLNTGKVD